MRYFRYGLLGVLAFALSCVAIANRGKVTLILFPNDIGDLVGINPSVETPLFLVIFLSVIVGLMIGFCWEWLREYKLRAEGSRSARKVNKLQREVRKLQDSSSGKKDEVLALLERTN